MRTVLLAGGGTGGHVYPLVAVADALKRLASEVHVVFVGTARGIEKHVVPECGYQLELVQGQPIRGAGVWGAAAGFWSAIGAMNESRRLLDRIRPSVVLTVGGYAAGPVSAAARLRGIPVALLEPNAVMGLSNLVLAPWVHRAYTAFPPAERRFSVSKVLRAGVPIREGFEPSSWRYEQRAQRILVLGGSQGARTLNENVPWALGQQTVALRVRHQCGTSDVDAVTRRYCEVGLSDCVVESFIGDMPAAITQADLIVSRSGASAVSEICAVGRASLLVPYPFAAGNHQEMNAASLATSGAAHWLTNQAATAERLSVELQRILADVDAIQQMADSARFIGRPQAASQIAGDLLRLAGVKVPQSSQDRDTRESN